jgi:hypothetical protein
MLSSEGHQNITYHCRNSMAFYDAAGQTYQHAIKMETNNELELTADGPLKARYDVLLDECQVSPTLG